jgi:hypothetical protein
VGVPIAMTLRVKKLSGTVRVWIPPPPGDRLWYGSLDNANVHHVILYILHM